MLVLGADHVDDDQGKCEEKHQYGGDLDMKGVKRRVADETSHSQW